MDVINEMIGQFNLASVSVRKLFIVFQAELMNHNAQNKLLKTIEEAHDATVLFLCQNQERILPTVRSRCITYYHQTKDNLTLQQMAAQNPDTPAIKQAANQFFTSTKIETAMNCLPILSKPENLPLAMDALNQALSETEFPAATKMAIYQALAKISRNYAANCNLTNTFDLLLLARF